jgi:3,4-dihydroxy 2-butanone 4-phosphate synthase/GTP cyclohydrolase II
LKHDSLIFPVASAALPTSYGGEFKAVVYNTCVDSSEHLALIKGEISQDSETLVRVCSRFLPGDVFGFALFDTGSVIKRSLEMIAEEGAGVILYLQPEGKSLRPNEARGDKSFREFGIGAQILRDLGVRKLRLITSNPKNLIGLSGYGLEVTSSVPLDRPQAPARKTSRASTLKG